MTSRKWLEMNLAPGSVRARLSAATFAMARPALPRIPSSSRRIWPEGWLTWGLAAAICWLYAWTAESNQVPFEFRGARNDYYNLLAHGFLHGETAMRVAPLAEPRAGPDPEGLGNLPYLLDASFYRGKYYLYFGPTPVLAMFLPYRLLTGGDVSDNFVGALFAGAGFLVALGLLAGVRRRYFPGAPGWLLPLGAVLLGLGNACVVMLRHPMFYEAAIAAAYFFEAIFMAALFQAMTARTAARRGVWLALGSAAIGLAVGARASHAVGAAALGLVLAWLWRLRAARNRAGEKPPWAALAALVLPVLGCALALMAYNAARFGRVTEFGVKYQFTYRPVFGPQYAWHNLKLYYFSLPEFSWFFPFTLPIDEGIRPDGYVGFEHLHGEAGSAVWLAVVAVTAVWLVRRRRREWRPLRWLYATLLLLFLGNLGVLLCLGGRADRYMVDFQPALLLLGAISLLLGAELVPAGARWRRPAAAGLVLVVALIGSHNVLSSLQLYEYFKGSNPVAYAPLATAMNAPSAWLGRWWYPRAGPVRMAVAFPARRPGELEPLVVAGSAESADFLMVRYAGAGKVRFVFLHYGHPEAVSDPVEVGVGETHQLAIDLGALYPPADHPFFAKLRRADRTLAKRRLQVSLDGKVVFARQQTFYDASPPQVYVGKNPFSRLYGAARFGGTITGVTREGLAALAARPARGFPGAARLQIRLPAMTAPLPPEPLVVTGENGRGDAIFLTYEDARHVRFGFDHWGAPAAFSEPVELDPGVPHAVEIAMGSLFAEKENPEWQGVAPYFVDALKQAVRVRLDGREVFRARSEFHPAAPTTADLGNNTIGLSSCSTHFSGDILGCEWISPRAMAPPMDDSWPGALTLRVRFPGQRADHSEPLLCTGRKQAGDVLSVSYVGPDQVQFALDHWGAGQIKSPLLRNDGAWHDLTIEMGSLRAAENLEQLAPFERGQAARRRQQLRLKLDGREVWTAQSDFFPSEPGQIAVGSNPIGASTCESLFTGSIDRVERAGSEPSGGGERPKSDYGPVRLELAFPRDRNGVTEPLVVTGRAGAGDVLAVTVLDARRVMFTWDHWGAGGPSSRPIELADGESHHLEIDMGSLYPEASAAMERALGPDEIARRRRRLLVRLDGETVFTADGEFHPSAPQDVQVGSNGIGASSTAPLFTGVIEHVERAGEPAAR